MTEKTGTAEPTRPAGAGGGAAPSRTARNLVVLLGIALAILHQDWWFRSDPSLVLGFIPISLFYHLCFSVSVAGLWALMSKYAWPTHIEEFAALGDVPAGGAPGAAVPEGRSTDAHPPAGGSQP